MATSNDTPTAHIEIFTCSKCNPHDSEHYGYVRPGYSLEGQIHITSASELVFEDSKISFQGLQSTTIFPSWPTPKVDELVAYTPDYGNPVVSRSSDKFLNLTYHANVDTAQTRIHEDGTIIYSLPFFFVMPRGVECPSGECPGSGTDSEPRLCGTYPTADLASNFEFMLGSHLYYI